jgi:hypothetical protein
MEAADNHDPGTPQLPGEVVGLKNQITGALDGRTKIFPLCAVVILCHEPAKMAHKRLRMAHF